MGANGMFYPTVDPKVTKIFGPEALLSLYIGINVRVKKDRTGPGPRTRN